MADVKKYSDILSDLTNRGQTIKAAAAKAASTKQADGVPSVPEKDPQDAGSASTPRDPNAAPAVQNLPASGTNTDQTPVAPTPPAKVISEPEKAAGLQAKAAKMLTTIQALKKSAGGTAAQISTNGSLPSDAGNDNKPKQTLAAPSAAPNGGKADPAVKESGKETPADKAQTSAPMPAGDTKGELPSETKNTNDTKAAAVEPDPDLANIGDDFFSKLAQTCLQFEEGRNVMEACLKKAHGAEHATNLIKTAMFMDQRMHELAELEQAGTSAAEEFWKSASDEDRAGLIKLASTHDSAMRSFSTDLEREAYLEGAKIAADMADAGMAGPTPPPGVPGMGGEGDPAGGAGAEGGEVSDEDIIQALQMLVQQGKISEEEAEMILQQLMGGGEGGEGGEGGGAEGAGGPPPEAGGDAGAGGPPPGAGAPPGAEAGGQQPPPPQGPEDKEAAAHLTTVGQTVDAIFGELTKKA